MGKPDVSIEEKEMFFADESGQGNEPCIGHLISGATAGSIDPRVIAASTNGVTLETREQWEYGRKENIRNALINTLMISKPLLPEWVEEWNERVSK